MTDKINRITNTPIINKSYSGYAIAHEGFHNKNTCIVQSDGTLWACPANEGFGLRLYRSQDNGFTWVDVRDLDLGILNQRVKAGLDHKGPLNHIIINEKHNALDIYMNHYQVTGGLGYALLWARFTISGVETDTIDDDNIWTGIYQTGSSAFSSNEQNTYAIYTDSNYNLHVVEIIPYRGTELYDTAFVTAGTTNDMFDCAIDEDSNLQIVVSALNSGLTTNQLLYAKYDPINLLGDGYVEIKDLGATTTLARDPCIAYDGTGSVCIFYGETDTVTSGLTNYYNISIDGGTTWQDEVALIRTASHGVYNDPIIDSWPSSRNRLIGAAEGGFMLMYTEDDANGWAKTYVRQLTTDDGGAVYNLGDEKQIATSENQFAHCTGGTFFTPPGEKLLEMKDPGLVRVAYQIGEPTIEDDRDPSPVKVGQELLYESAFPSSLASETGSYTLETHDGTESLLLSMVFFAGPSANVDFYDEGLVGSYTTKYINAFNQIGTSLRFLQFEPDSTNEMNDRSAYNAPTESYANVIFDPVSYTEPAVELESTAQEAWVEQDIRKIYISPSKHLSRTFLTNGGGYLKRTVWLVEFNGNQYEVSQVTPKFHSQEICYYEANAYVVGPSRDPFSRAVLPSES